MPYDSTGGALARDFGLGNFWDDVYGIAGKVQTAAGAIGSVQKGETRVALVPAGQTSIVPGGSGMFTAGVPVNWPLYLAIGLGAYLLLKGRR